jgi:hypothetical protein
MKPLPLVLAAAAVAGLAFFAGRLSAEPASSVDGGAAARRETDAAARRKSERDDVRGAAASRGVARDAFKDVGPADAAAIPNDDPRFSPELREFFLAEYRAGWASLRQDEAEAARIGAGFVQFKDDVLALPRRLGEDAAKVRTAEEALAAALTGKDGVGAHRALQEGLWKPKPEDLEGALLDGLVARRAAGPDVDGTTVNADRNSPPAAGTTLNFGPGVHRFNPGKLNRRDPYAVADDVALVGAGMDSTLLVFEGSTDFRAAVRGFSIRNLTLFANCDFIDQRGEPLTLTLERVRVTGFDCGAGSQTALNSWTGALLTAVDCEFAGGYGRSPEHGGYAIGGRSFVARFDRCRFERCALWHSAPSQSTILFRACTFSNVARDPLLDAGPTIRFTGCNVESVRKPEDPPLPALKLSDLFPAYGK